TYCVESQTSSGGVVCTSSRTPVTISVTTPTAPTITPSGSTTFCQGRSVTLNASGGPNHIWSNGATGSSIVVTSPGNYTVQSVAGTCTSAVSNTITVNTHPVPTAPTITAMGPTSFCQGGSVVLNSNAASGITWSGGAGTGTTATITTSG